MEEEVERREDKGKKGNMRRRGRGSGEGRRKRRENSKILGVNICPSVHL